MAYSVTIGAIRHAADAPWKLQVRGPGETAQTDFDEKAAEELSRAFTEIMEIAHGLRPCSGEPMETQLDRLERRLWEEIFTDDTGRVLSQHCQRAGAQLNVWVRGPAALVNLPWEILKRDEQSLCVYHGVPLVRTVPEEVSRVGIPQQGERVGKLRILFVPAAPANLEPVEWREARIEFEHELWHWRQLGLVEWEELGEGDAPNTLKRLHDRISGSRETYDVVSLLAHGRYEGGPGSPPRPELALVGQDGNADWKSVEEIVPALTRRNVLPRLVLLGCCHLARVAPSNPYGGFARELLQRGVPAVVSMQATVSVEGAAKAAAGAVRSILMGKSLGQVMLDCRLRMPPFESVLPTAWLHHKYDPQRPLATLKPLDREKLVAEAQSHQGDPSIGLEVSERMLAGLCYLDDLSPLELEERRLERFYRDEVAASRMEQIRAGIRANSRPAAASGIITLERIIAMQTCGALATPLAEEFERHRQWALEPVEGPMRAGLELAGDGRWDEAINCFEEAAGADAKGDYALERLWRGSQRRARRNIQHARVWLGVGEVDPLWDQGEYRRAADQKRQAVQDAQQLAVIAREEFGYLTAQIAQWEQELAIEEQVADAWDELDRFDWDPALERLRNLGQGRSVRVDPADQQLAQTGQRLEERWGRAQDLAREARWDEACRLVDRELEPPAPPPEFGSREARRQQLLERWRSQRAVDVLHRRWAELGRMDRALARLLQGPAVACTDAEPHDVRLALRAEPADVSVVEQTRAGLPACSTDDLRQRLTQALGPDAPCCFILMGERDTAREALAEVVRQGGDREAACHPLAVITLDRALHEAESPDAPEWWEESLAAWCVALAKPDYWARWSRRSCGQAWEPERIDQLLAGLRRGLASRLAGRDRLVPLLESACLQTASPEERGELVELELELAGRAVGRGDWAQVRNLWDTALRHADQANRLPSTGMRVFETAGEWTRSWQAANDAAALDRCVELWKAACEVLQGTDRHLSATEALSLAHVDRGLFYLPFWHGESLAVSYQDFETAYNLSRNLWSTLGFLVSVIVLAGAPETADNRDHLLDVAQGVLAEAEKRWSHEALVQDARQLVQDCRGSYEAGEQLCERILNARKRHLAEQSAELGPGSAI